RIASDGEAVAPVPPLAPPPVKDAEVEAAVHGRLHSAGSAGLEGAPRIVEPHVAAAGHLSAHVNVVVLDEHQPAVQLGVLAQMNDLLDVTLAGVVPRMRLARENELHRTLRIPRQPHD